MKVLIVYATTEGQTRKIASFAFRHLVAQGHSVALLAAADGQDCDASDYDAVIVAASVHAGRYQREMRDFATSERDLLKSVRTLFLSVSLAAAGEDDSDWKELDQIVKRMVEETGWTPDRVEHVAGAFRFSEYDFFKYWAMRWIESKKDASAEAGTDREYTDWEALAALLDNWLSDASSG